MKLFFTIVQFHLLQLLRQRGQVLASAGFFLVTVAIFPLAVGAEQKVLSQIGGGIVWITAFLAAMLPVHLYYDDDYRDGTLEVLVMQARSMEVLVMAKILVQWLAMTVPMMLVTPILVLLLQMEPGVIIRIMYTLMMGMLVLISLGALAASVTLGLKQRSGLAYMLLLPLTVPVLIFGVGTLQTDRVAEGAFTFLCGLCLLLVPLCVLLSAAAIRLSVRH